MNHNAQRGEGDGQTTMLTETQNAIEVARTFRVQTLGCKVNQADSEAIAAELVARGYAKQLGAEGS